MHKFLFFAVILLFLCELTSGQLSQGGRPLTAPSLKSSSIPVIDMPSIDSAEIEMRNTKLLPDEPAVKSLRFGYGFDVHISPQQDGLWTVGSDGFDLWQVTIRSSGAFSLSLIFEDFHLPEGARLYLFNEIEEHYLGAYTSLNNKRSGKFAVSPVAGDFLTVQYEVPSGSGGRRDFVIRHVGHDYLGIVKNERRPMKKTAGFCNIDINCTSGLFWSDEKDAVCRIIISKTDLPGRPREICTGTMINHNSKNNKAYILTASHCINKSAYAESAIFTFNYESPYCAPLDGDPGNSITGATLLAHSDSLDFALVELSLVPPPEFRPYYAGWDRRKALPDSSASIHHPQGDIKKIAIDRNAPFYSNFAKAYTPQGFYRIARWEEGVTEAGSSGGALFNYQRKLIGTLTGGLATCTNPVNDYYSRFDMAWDYKSDSSGQLKYWLDPNGDNIQSLPGKRVYDYENLCMAFTNLEDDDTHQNRIIREDGRFAGYWGGSNSAGITEFAERFVVQGGAILHGVSMGVGKLMVAGNTEVSELKVSVYNGDNSPGEMIFSKSIEIKNFVSDAMNFIGFDEPVEVADEFFVGFELSNVQLQDTFVVYQSLRTSGKENFFWFKKDELWSDYSSANSDNFAMTNVFELIACNFNVTATDTPKLHLSMEMLIYPNPANSAFFLEAEVEFSVTDVHVFNLIGQVVDARKRQEGPKKIQIDLSGNIPGVYFVRMKTKIGLISRKVTFIPR